MGRYINEIDGKPAPTHGKVKFIMDNTQAERIDAPEGFSEGIVCVVDNFAFEAAAYCYSPAELREFLREDGRKKTWLKVPNAAEIAQ